MWCGEISNVEIFDAESHGILELGWLKNLCGVKKSLFFCFLCKMLNLNLSWWRKIYNLIKGIQLKQELIYSRICDDFSFLGHVISQSRSCDEISAGWDLNFVVLKRDVRRNLRSGLADRADLTVSIMWWISNSDGWPDLVWCSRCVSIDAKIWKIVEQNFVNFEILTVTPNNNMTHKERFRNLYIELCWH